MKTIELAEATESLRHYARAIRGETLVVTLKGKPVAALTPLGPNTDMENLAVSSNPQFRALIERSRRRHPAGSGLSSGEVRQVLRSGRRTTRRPVR